MSNNMPLLHVALAGTYSLNEGKDLAMKRQLMVEGNKTQVLGGHSTIENRRTFHGGGGTCSPCAFPFGFNPTNNTCL